MPQEKLVPPRWWPPGDPGPDPWGGGGGPWGNPWWFGWWRRHVPFPIGDPPPDPLRERLTELLKNEDLVRLEQARLVAAKADYEAGLRYLNDLGKNQLAYLDQLAGILKNAGPGK